MVNQWPNRTQSLTFLAKIDRTLLSYGPGVTRNFIFSFKDLNGMIVMLIINNFMYTKVGWVVIKWSISGQLWHEI